jgi:hypothetical protein
VHTVLVPYSPSYIFYMSSPSHWYQLPRQDLFCLPVLSLYFKKWHFCLFKIAIQGVSFLWHFYVYMYYNLSWFIPSSFLFSTLVPFLWWFQQV